MSYRTHKRRPTSIATDEIFKSQIANTYVAADGQILQSSMVKNGSPSKRQLAGSTSQVRFSLPAPESDSEADITREDITNLTDDEEEQDAANIENDEPVQRTESYFAHKHSFSEDILRSATSESLLNEKNHKKTISVAESLTEVLTGSSDRNKLFIKPNSSLNHRVIPIPMEVQLPPLISPRNSHRIRPTNLVYNGSSYEPVKDSILDKSKSFSTAPKKSLFINSSLHIKTASVPDIPAFKSTIAPANSQQLISSSYNGRISIPDLSKPHSPIKFKARSQTLDNEEEIKNPSPAAKRQNNMLNKAFSFPNLPRTSSEITEFENVKTLSDIPVSLNKPDNEIASGLKLFTENSLDTPTKNRSTFGHIVPKRAAPPIIFHQRRKSQILTFNQPEEPIPKDQHKQTDIQKSPVPVKLYEPQSYQSHRISSSKYSDFSTVGLNKPTERNVSGQSTSSSQYSVDSIQESLQESYQSSIQESIQLSIELPNKSNTTLIEEATEELDTFGDVIPESGTKIVADETIEETFPPQIKESRRIKTPETTKGPEIVILDDSIIESEESSDESEDESIGDITQQLQDLGLSILKSSNDLMVNNTLIEQLDKGITLTRTQSDPTNSASDSDPDISEIEILDDSIQELPIQQVEQIDMSTVKDQFKKYNLEPQLSYNNQQLHRVFPRDTIEFEKISSSKVRKNLMSPTLSQSSYESELSQPFSNAPSVDTNATSVVNLPEVIDLTNDYEPQLIIKKRNMNQYNSIMNQLNNKEREVIIIDDDEKEEQINNSKQRPKSCLGNIEFSRSDRAFSNFSFETVASEVQLYYNPSNESSNSSKSLPISQYPISNQSNKYDVNNVLQLCDNSMKNSQTVIDHLKRQKTILINKHHDALRRKKAEEKKLIMIRQRQADLSKLGLKVQKKINEIPSNNDQPITIL